MKSKMQKISDTAAAAAAAAVHTAEPKMPEPKWWMNSMKIIQFRCESRN